MSRKPSIQAKDDVIIKVVRACVCGSDLWNYGEHIHHDHGDTNTGHEAIGIVEEVNKDITYPLLPGDFVIVPFTHGCGHCDACRAVTELVTTTLAIRTETLVQSQLSVSTMATGLL